MNERHRNVHRLARSRPPRVPPRAYHQSTCTRRKQHPCGWPDRSPSNWTGGTSTAADARWMMWLMTLHQQSHCRSRDLRKSLDAPLGFPSPRNPAAVADDSRHCQPSSASRQSSLSARAVPQTRRFGVAGAVERCQGSGGRLKAVADPRLGQEIRRARRASPRSSFAAG